MNIFFALKGSKLFIIICCGSLLPVLVLRVLVTVHVMCDHIIFSSVLVAEWPPFGKKLLTWLTICSLCILTICDISFFWFWF